MYFTGENGVRYVEKLICTLLRLIISITTLISSNCSHINNVVLLAIWISWLQYLVLKNSGKLVESQNYFSLQYIKPLTIEILILLIHNPPGVNYTFYMKNYETEVLYSISTFISLLMLSRFYLIPRFIARTTIWMTEQAEIICRIEGFQNNLSFAIKCLLKQKPYHILSSLFFGGIVIIGLTVRYFER